MSKIESRLSALNKQLSPDPIKDSPISTLACSGGGLLQGEVAIITGSGQGIGEACAILFAQQGASVVVTDIDASKSDAVAKKIKESGGEAISVPGDITQPDFPEKLVKETVAAFGKINHIINNAGYTWDGVLHKMTDKQWEAMLLVHNTAPFRLVRAATEYMREAGKQELEKTGQCQNRCIINISSTSGLHGNFGQANYSTAKMGVVGFTKTVAKEWGPFGVRCNAVAFGFIQTRLTAAKQNDNFIEVEGKKIPLGIPQGTRSFDAVPLRRAGTVAEAAGGVLLFCLPHSSYITGHTLEVTGGAGI